MRSLHLARALVRPVAQHGGCEPSRAFPFGERSEGVASVKCRGFGVVLSSESVSRLKPVQCALGLNAQVRISALKIALDRATPSW
jgi:hypothetical protein